MPPATISRQTMTKAAMPPELMPVPEIDMEIKRTKEQRYYALGGVTTYVVVVDVDATVVVWVEWVVSPGDVDLVD